MHFVSNAITQDARIANRSRAPSLLRSFCFSPRFSVLLFRVVAVEISIDVYGNGTGNLDIRATDAARSLKIEIGRLMSCDAIRNCDEATI